MTELMSEALGLHSSYILDSIGKAPVSDSLFCYYPRQLLNRKDGVPFTPQGLTPHTDISVLDFMLHNFTQGLQFFMEGQWRDVPIVHPYGLCVIVGDCLEVTTP